MLCIKLGCQWAKSVQRNTWQKKFLEHGVACTVQAAAVAEAVFKCLDCASRNVAEIAVQFFEILSTVPVAKRSPAFRAPVFGRMLPPLLRHARYPQGFTFWEECVDDDSDEFHRFRWLPR